MKYNYLILSICLLFSQTSKAEEGMWLLNQMGLIEKDMKAKGLILSKEDIYSINKSSIKDAVVSFGGFCTAEIISEKGLLLTNHHCGDDFIRKHSTVEKNYLKNGFWAKDFEEELPNKNLYVKFLISVEDVTSKVLKNVKQNNDTLSFEKRKSTIQENIDSIINNLQKDSNLVYKIEGVFEDNQFLLFKYKYYQDIRLVGAPPERIGVFGGDKDNWMWPRHTGDFALFRIYSDSTGESAKYSSDNKPFVPKYFLKISKKGFQENDFTMVLGFPGRTDRFLTSYGVKEAVNQTNPLRVKIRDKKLKIYSEYMDKSEKTKLEYADDYSSVSNYWKYYIGQTEGIKKNKVYEKKIKIEEQFLDWCNEQDSLLKKYGHVLMNISDCYNRNEKINLYRVYLSEAVFSGPKTFRTAYSLNRIMNLYEGKKVSKEELKIKLNEIYIKSFDEFNYDIDLTLFIELMTMYKGDLKNIEKPDIFSLVEKRHQDNWYKFGQTSYKKSFLSNKEKFLSFVKQPSLLKFKQDPLIKTFNSIYDFYVDNMYDERQKIRKELKEYKKLYVEGIMEMQKNKNFYPDANSTMRISYGTIKKYKGDDAIEYNHYTTQNGILEKSSFSDKDFFVSDKLTKLLEKKDFEKYADKNGDLVINFISTNDITGGNSGSPVLNKNGDLIGLAFDGNWEGMSSDISYEINSQRTISVDIRYILFVIDKIGEADNLIKEMVIKN